MWQRNCHMNSKVELKECNWCLALSPFRLLALGTQIPCLEDTQAMERAKCMCSSQWSQLEGMKYHEFQPEALCFLNGATQILQYRD